MVGAITALVGTEGHQVITAYDGLTAVKRFREEAPDIVLLDLAMPGPGRLHRGRPDPRGRAAPILVVSGESGEEAKVGRSGSGPTTTSSSRSAGPSCWPGSRRSCAGSTGRRAVRRPAR